MIKFYSLPNCPPCQMMEDVLDDHNINYTKVDIRPLGVSMQVPRLVLEYDNKELAAIVGFNEHQLLKFLSQNQLL